MKAKNEYKTYLKKLRISKIRVLFCQISIFLLFIITWQVLADKKIISIFLFSSPTKIVQTIINLATKNELFIHILVTLKEIF